MNLETLLDFENAFNPAFAALISQSGITVFQDRNPSLVTTGRVECRIEVGAATAHRGYLAPDADGTPQAIHDAWNATFIFAVVTNRPKSKHDPLLHGRLCARVRSLMTAVMRAGAVGYSTPFGPALLPNHAVANIAAAGSHPHMDSTVEEDATELHFSAVISIRPEKLALVTC